MAVQPPKFGAKRSQPRKAWTPSGPYKHKRIRGRAGVKLRKQVREEEPLCRTCLENGRTRATQEIDHIVPLSRGGSNARANLQGVCEPCHKAKSERERALGA
ncbi:HNH endonuclease [Sphingomonas sp. 3-13AW]|uniref:HNH endonuclease n=1 Tax=Sphingomonas sp. 3-13AW TaxID=3050450 RepID=UPI003BB74C43